MKCIHVIVMVQDIVWDEFIFSQEDVLFLTFNNQYSNSDVAYLKLIKANKLIMSQYEVSTLMNSIVNNMKHINGQNIPEKVNILDITSHEKGNTNTLKAQECRTPQCVQELCINGYLLSLFVKTLRLSAVYRKSVLTNFKKYIKKTGRISQLSDIMKVNMKLVCPHKHIIDFTWNNRLERLAVERRELDNVMSWLSTLGGAFSALGEEFKHCAEIAARISAQQFSIALRLGDPLTVARCKLYLALSLVQRGRLVPARHIIEQQYHLAQSAVVVDARLISMCLGIWAKLKYEHHKRITQQRGGRKCASSCMSHSSTLLMRNKSPSNTLLQKINF